MGIELHPNIINLNTLFESLKNVITTKQGSWGVLHEGELFQGLDLIDMDTEGLPNGVISLDTQTNVKPEDRNDSWTTFDSSTFVANLKLPANVSLKVKDTIQGWIWIMKMEFWYDGIGPDTGGRDGNHWIKQCYVGPVNPYPGAIFDTWYIQPESNMP